MGGGISKMAKQELVATIRDRYRQASKKDKGRILDEFTAITGHHRKHGIRLLGGTADNKGKQAVGRRIYDEAVREAVIVVWEAPDRICGKRLKAALPNFVDSMERHGHLSLDPAVRERLLSASAATLDRLLKPIRTTAGSRRKRRRRPYMGSQIPVRTYNDWNWPPPGFLEIVFSVNYFCRFRQLFLPVHPLFLTVLLGHSGAVARDVEFQDDRVVDHPVDGRRRGHWVGEDVLPLGEDQIGRDAQGPAFVAFGDEREEHLGLLGPLGQVPQVVQQQEVVVVELS